MNIDELFIEANTLPKKLENLERNELLLEIEKGNKTAFEKLLMHNIRFVLYKVGNYDYNDKKDLVSVGIIGLIKAIKTFNDSKQTKFETYISICIDNEIKMFLRQTKKQKLNDSLDKIIRYDNNKEITLKDSLVSDVNIEEEYINKEMCERIRKIVNNLPEREKTIIMMHFGFYDNKRYTQDEIAQKLNLTQSYVSKLISKQVKSMRNKLENDENINCLKKCINK